MPLPRPTTKLVFVLVPTEIASLELAVNAGRAACRVALQTGFKPMCPLLYYLTFLSPGELGQQKKHLFLPWVRRTDRIWLQFPDSEDETLDTLSYDILEANRRSARRKPVYQLHPAGDEFLPVAMYPEEIKQLLAINVSSGLASCI